MCAYLPDTIVEQCECPEVEYDLVTVVLDGYTDECEVGLDKVPWLEERRIVRFEPAVVSSSQPCSAH